MTNIDAEAFIRFCHGITQNFKNPSVVIKHTEQGTFSIGVLEEVNGKWLGSYVVESWDPDTETIYWTLNPAPLIGDDITRLVDDEFYNGRRSVFHNREQWLEEYPETGE